MTEPIHLRRGRILDTVTEDTTPSSDKQLLTHVDAEALADARRSSKDGGPKAQTEGGGRTPHARELAAKLSQAEDALTALGAAGIASSIVDAGSKRTSGLGITVPVMAPRPRLGVPLEVYASTPLQPFYRSSALGLPPSSLDPGDRLKQMRIAVSADHGAYGRAEETAEILRRLGVGEVVIIAPKEPERLNYAISTSAALDMLASGRVDRVVSFCGNGLGALDVANIFSEMGRGERKAEAPIYGDNFWTVVDGQRRDPPANVLCLGARLLNVEGDPLAAYLKAFLDAPANIDALGNNGSPAHGVSSSLIDPKPERVANRTLKEGDPFAGATIAEQAKLSKPELARIRQMDVSIYYDASSTVVKQQAKSLERMLPKTVKLIAWDGEKLPEIEGSNARVLLLTENGSGLGDQRTWGFFRPERVQDSRLRAAEHWYQAASFARNADGGPLFLDVDCRAFADKATGGRSHDVLRLVTKAFLLTERGEATAQKKLYGEAIEFALSVATGEPRPDLASWNQQYDELRLSS